MQVQLESLTSRCVKKFRMGTKSVADASPLSEGLAVAVRVHLARRGMTRRHLVEVAGRSEPYWSKRLTGTAGLNLADVESLAEAFDITPDLLIRDAMQEVERLEPAPDPQPASKPLSMQELKQRRMLEQAQPMEWAADDREDDEGDDEGEG
uniref:HTH cro/C1-type domain-containing protein n=1 Tax=Dulem virus 32 TaxID=3145750 RepID=A0AAU8B0K5_9CAUD